MNVNFMLSFNNNQILLKRRPTGWVTPDDFELVQTPMPTVATGQVLIKNQFLSLDPYMRGRMNDAKSYAEPAKLGEVMVGGTVGEVIESQHSKFAIGDQVVGMLGWQTYGLSDGRGLQKIGSKSNPSPIPLSVWLGAAGMPGVTAYAGLFEIGQPKAGETVLVSAAAGAVGSMAGQIAKHDGARVIGIAGGPAKAAYLLDTLGFDAAIDYKNEDVNARLRELCPGGLNVFFDNVGGPILDAALDNLALRARVVLCGAVSQYDDMDHVVGPSLYLRLAERQSRMEGYAYFHFLDDLDEAAAELANWLREGSLQVT
ncbi:MAG: NADP-dependent oxidoreductase, partial [Chloroflexota bacterium]